MKTRYYVIGLMSGTSLDGLDIAYCEFKAEGDEWEWTIPFAETVKYDKYLYGQLKAAPAMNGLELALLNTSYGHWIGHAVTAFIDKYNLHPDLIASHGHTVFHRPSEKMTLQIGSGAAIAAEIMITTVSDFRSLNVALGGQGAPLVPIGDRMLFGKFDACVNIGGFANISFESSDKKRVAFDICPANIVLNILANRFGMPYDSYGKLAAEGSIDPSLFNKLENLEFYKRKGPKSLGREWVEHMIFPLIENSGLDTKTLLSTFTNHIASQISSTLPSGKARKVIFTGGGTHNSRLISLIKEKTSCEIVIPEENVINFKEALIFAFLGVLRIKGMFNCLADATGSSLDCSGGAIHLPPQPKQINHVR